MNSDDVILSFSVDPNDPKRSFLYCEKTRNGKTETSKRSFISYDIEDVVDKFLSVRRLNK